MTFILLTMMVAHGGDYFTGPVAIAYIPFHSQKTCLRAAAVDRLVIDNTSPQIVSICFTKGEKP